MIVKIISTISEFLNSIDKHCYPRLDNSHYIFLAFSIMKIQYLYLHYMYVQISTVYYR
jgi:hypothetical protein